jgi:predicted aldo/keto reductase-like oxidoreductase
VLAEQEDSSDGLPKRPLGKTGVKVRILCLGGWHIGAIEEKDAIALMHEAIDEGLTFFDNAWDYHDGGSEEVMPKDEVQKLLAQTQPEGSDGRHELFKST